MLYFNLVDVKYKGQNKKYAVELPLLGPQWNQNHAFGK